MRKVNLKCDSSVLVFSLCCLNNPNIKGVSGQGEAVDNIKKIKPNKYWERKVAYWALSRIIKKGSGRLGLRVEGRRESDGERSIMIWIGSLDSKLINENLGKQEALRALCHCAQLGFGSVSPNSSFQLSLDLDLKLPPAEFCEMGSERRREGWRLHFMLLSGSCLHIAQKMSLSPYLIYEPFLTPALSVLVGAVFLWKFIFKTTNKIAFSFFRKSAFC